MLVRSQHQLGSCTFQRLKMQINADCRVIQSIRNRWVKGYRFIKASVDAAGVNTNAVLGFIGTLYSTSLTYSRFRGHSFKVTDLPPPPLVSTCVCRPCFPFSNKVASAIVSAPPPHSFKEEQVIERINRID